MRDCHTGFSENTRKNSETFVVSWFHVVGVITRKGDNSMTIFTKTDIAHSVEKLLVIFYLIAFKASGPCSPGLILLQSLPFLP